MPALPPNSTARYKVFYTNLGHQHTLQLRSDESPSSIGTLVDALFTTITGSIATTTIDVVEWAPTGSDIFNPVTSGIEGNIYGIGGHPASDVATFWSLVGRTPGARRVRVYFFGMGGMGGDYRYNSGENAAADNLQATMAAAGSDVLGIDGGTPIWKNYVNAGVNVHLQRALRP
jgi:hypothetical protein